MTILRSGSTKKYADNWEKAFKTKKLVTKQTAPKKATKKTKKTKSK